MINTLKASFRIDRDDSVDRGGFSGIRGMGNGLGFRNVAVDDGLEVALRVDSFMDLRFWGV